MTSFAKAAYRSSVSAVALGFFVTGSAAWADVTAQDVWNDWKGYFAGSGYEVSAEETLSGDTLSVENVVMNLVIPEEDTTINVELGDITFVEQGDGSVSVAFPETTEFLINVDGPELEDLQVAMDYITSDFQMNVSGDPDDLVYTYTAAEIALKFKEIVAEGQSVDLGKFDVTVADLSGITKMKVGDVRVADQEITTGAVNYDIDFADPENEEGRFKIKGAMAGMEAKGVSTLPLEMDAALMHEALNQGFAVDAEMTFSNNAAEFNFADGTDTFEGNSSSVTGRLEVAMSDKGLLYDVSTKDTKMFLLGGAVPLPLEFSLEESGFKLGIPIAKSDDVQDFALGFKMGNFVMSDLLWGIFDPAGQLPRDPATIEIDLTGQAKVFLDFMNAQAMVDAEDSGETPGEIHSLTLNTLILRAAGAELTGDGAFTFDNDDLETFDGMPAPEGAVDLMLVGANTLLDTLVNMGFVPQGQANEVRIMMGLFAVPGDGEDTLQSRIEIKGNGQVLANGQRLR